MRENQNSLLIREHLHDYTLHVDRNISAGQIQRHNQIPTCQGFNGGCHWLRPSLYIYTWSNLTAGEGGVQEQ